MPTASTTLAEKRVDLVALVEGDELPEREYVPGSSETIPRGARVHIAAKRKTGKSLAFCTSTGLRIVKAGGTVAVLDRENGEAESARRMRSVLEAWEAPPELYEAVRARYHYYAFPALDLSWCGDQSYLETFGGCDVVFFDSSRSHLTRLGLKENNSDDFAAFVEALSTPLFLSGVSTVVLDNTGWDNTHARGSSSKDDLAEVIYKLDKSEPFTLWQRGTLELDVVDCRFGDHFGTWTMSVGAGTYEPWLRSGEAEAEPPLADEVVKACAQEWAEVQGALHRSEIERRLGRGPKDGSVGRAITAMVELGRVKKLDDGRIVYSVP